MPHNHIMVDLETFGKSKDAAIVSIGAVRFDLDKGELGDRFYQVVNLNSAQRAGGKIDAETVMWWMGQGEEARKALTGDDSVPIENALKNFSNWIREKPLEALWGNGADFDNVIIEGAYQRLGWTPPWAYYQNHCYRTLCSLKPDLKRNAFRNAVDTAHNALGDAITQAKHLCAIWKLIKVG